MQIPLLHICKVWRKKITRVRVNFTPSFTRGPLGWDEMLQWQRGKFSQQVKMEMACRNETPYELQEMLMSF